jgi:gluconokinase
VLLMGVSGSGKSTLGLRVSERLGWRFFDADDFHSESSKAKMRQGFPLDDADRAPWLAALRRQVELQLSRAEPALLACSALKASYREQLGARLPGVFTAWLDGDPTLLRQRLAARQGHFFPPALLDSQLAALEAPSGALRLDFALPPAALEAQLLEALRAQGA